MGRNPEAGGNQPFNNRVEGAKSTIKALKKDAQKALDSLLAPPASSSRLVIETTSPPLTGKLEAPSDLKQTAIQRTQTQDRGTGAKTTIETDLTQEELEKLEEARRRRLQEEIEAEGGPTQEDAVSANGGKLTSRTIDWIKKHPLASAGIGIGGFSLIAAGTNAILDNRTEAHQSIENTGNSGKSFEATKLKDVIGDNNVADVSLSDIQDLPQFNSDGRPIILIAAPPPGKTSSVERSANFNDIGIERIGSFNTEELFNIINVDLHPNEPIPMPINGYLIPYWINANWEGGDGRRVLGGVLVFFELPNGRIGKIGITTSDVRDKLPEEIKNIEFPAITKDIYKNKNWEKQGLKMKRGSRVLIAPEDKVKYPVEYYYQEIDPITGLHYPSGISGLMTEDSKFPRIK